MANEEEEATVVVNLRQLRIVLDRVMGVIDSIGDLDKSVLDLIRSITPQLEDHFRSEREEQERIESIINETDIPDNVIPLIKKEEGHEPTELA